MYDHRKYQLTPTGRAVRPEPVMQHLHKGFPRTEPLVEVDLATIELRMLALMEEENGTETN